MVDEACGVHAVRIVLRDLLVMATFRPSIIVVWRGRGCEGTASVLARGWEPKSVKRMSLTQLYSCDDAGHVTVVSAALGSVFRVVSINAEHARTPSHIHTIHLAGKTSPQISQRRSQYYIQFLNASVHGQYFDIPRYLHAQNSLGGVVSKRPHSSVIQFSQARSDPGPILGAATPSCFSALKDLGKF